MKTITILAGAMMMLSACSDSTGIAEVDKAKNNAMTATGVQTDLAPISRAAKRAIEKANTAGESGSADQMAKAISTGTGEVLCAGYDNKGEISGQIARDVDVNTPDSAEKRKLTEAYEGLKGTMPDLPSPC